MPTRIRLKRFGRKKRPHYRIVIADSRAPRDGAGIEEIGYYDPISEPPTLKIDEDRAVHWLLTGAQPTDVVRALLRRAGVLARVAQIRREQRRRKAEEKAGDHDSSQTQATAPSSEGEDAA